MIKNEESIYEVFKHVCMKSLWLTNLGFTLLI